jgi:hypothetical protein
MFLSMTKAECFAATALMVVAGAAFAVSFSFVVDGVQATEFGPDLYPKGTAAALFLASALWLVSSLRKLRYPSLRSEEDGELATKDVILRDAAAFLVCCVYVAAIGWLGYYASTFLFLALSMWMLGLRRWLMILAIAAGYTASSYFLFDRLLMIRLPAGILM